MSDREVLRRVRRAYEVGHLRSGVRGIAAAAAVTIAAAALHRTSSTSWLIAIALASTLGVLAYRGGAWRRGAFAGVLAGLPPLIVPTLVIALSNPTHCESCTAAPMWWCVLSCFVASSLVGAFVGHRATVDHSPPRYAIGALSTAALTGLLGCGTTGLGGAAGIVIGLIAGGVTGWVVSGRAARAPNV